MDYAEASCGASDAILTTTGCVTAPPKTATPAEAGAQNPAATQTKAVNNPDDVGSAPAAPNNQNNISQQSKSNAASR